MPQVITPNRIRTLPTLVANQIAAGEVVERPASVVKECVENSIDAGATRITVDLEQGGIELVRITDDGSGIAEADLPMAIAPHATSKIVSAQDLERVATLGFRGEALASIASVARLSIRSRTADQTGAFVIEVDWDRHNVSGSDGVKPAAGPIGTCITVRNLFYNTPARRKFLRTVGTEQERCLDVMRQLAMAHPAIGFRATCDGRVVMDLPPGQSPRDRVLGVLGGELEDQLLEVNADEFDDSRGVSLWGLVGLPGIARGTNKHQYVFVNGRCVKDRTIQHAIAEAYRGLIDPSRYPTAVLMLELSPAGVDVNVHPAKAEVRFRDGSLVHSVVLRSVREALRAADLTPSIAPAFRPVVGDVALPGSGMLTPPPAQEPPSLSRFVEYFKAPQPDGVSQPLNYTAMRETLSEPRSAAPTNHAGASPVAQEIVRAESPPPRFEVKPVDRVLQVHNSFLVTQDEQGVVIIDQHALHERVMFEYLLARVWAGGLESQQLLAPAVVQVATAQLDRLADLTPLLEKIGISVSPLGKTSVGVNAFPSFLFDRGVDPIEFMQELLEKAETGALRGAGVGKDEGEAALREVLDMMACKAAVKAGDRMSELELAELVKLRGEVERSSNCPHGRPTSIRLTIKELEKLFGRT
ncbi:MAG TPA: DNA mismatch repair endonuclease MutL [Phycisphaerales bacterium]|nr:DNA mismatch repair endonuclease MutL [Phycisphaerales bacterium]